MISRSSELLALIFVLVVSFGLVAAFFSWFFLRWLRRIRSQKAPYHTVRVQFPHPHVISAELAKKAQFSASEAQTLRENCDKLSCFGLSHLVLIHGTFRGHDPLHLLPLLKNVMPPRFSEQVQKPLKNFFRASASKYWGNLGIYSEKHVEILRAAGSPKIVVENFIWSSGNHHFARVEGSLNLLAFIAELLRKTAEGKKKRVMLMAHSHGGQLLALLSRYLNEPNFSKSILRVVRKSSPTFDPDQFRRDVAILKDVQYDLVTFGTPYRYHYHLTKQIRLLHFINDRCELQHFAPFDLQGIINTRDGDYPQKWGVAGSDFLASTKTERDINRELDRLLGPGSKIQNLKRVIENSPYVPKQGLSLLVDYRDQGTYNAWKTLFGHGIYTAVGCTAFHLEMIFNYLYTKQKIQ